MAWATTSLPVPLSPVMSTVDAVGATDRIIVTTAPHLGRPMRFAGRWIVGLGALGTVFTQEATVGATLAALRTGLRVSRSRHLRLPEHAPQRAEVQRLLDALR